MKPKRPCRFLSSEKGLLSLEASIVVTIFIFFVLFLQSFFVVFEARNEMAHVTLAACNSLALEAYEIDKLTDSSATLNFFLHISGRKHAQSGNPFAESSFWYKLPKGKTGDGIWNGSIYASEDAQDLADKKEQEKADKTGVPNTKTRDAFGELSPAVNTALQDVIRKRFTAYLAGGDKEQANRLLKRYHIVNTIDKLDFSGSYISSGKLYLSVKYDIRYTFNTFSLLPIRFEHTACSKLWT